MKSIATVVGWLVLLAAFASIGFTTDDPGFGIPFYLVFFVVTFLLVYLYVKTHQKHHQTNMKTVALLHRIVGIILLVVAVFCPTMIFRSANFPAMTYVIISLITIVLIGVGSLAITMINSEKEKNMLSKLLGYLLLILISAVPAFVMMSYDSSYNALGTAYYAALSIAIFSWWGFSLYSRKD